MSQLYHRDNHGAFMPYFRIYEEYLTPRSIYGSTKGTDIFREFQSALLETELDPSKLFGVATDACPSMIQANRRLQGLINKWREENAFDPVTWHRCILHQESLVAKSLDMSYATEVVISDVHWIRANALNNRKFKDFPVMLALIMVTWLCSLLNDG